MELVGVGSCQWAAQMSKVLKVRPLNCDLLIWLDQTLGVAYEDYESVDIVKRVMEVTDGKGVKSVIDGIGKNTVDISIGSLAHRGIFIGFGNASGVVPAFLVLRFMLFIQSSSFLPPSSPKT